jgi:hypothetical protein
MIFYSYVIKIDLNFIYARGLFIHHSYTKQKKLKSAKLIPSNRESAVETKSLKA